MQYVSTKALTGKIFLPVVWDDGSRLGRGFGGFRRLLEGAGEAEDPLDLKKLNFFDFAQILHGGWG